MLQCSAVRRTVRFIDVQSHSGEDGNGYGGAALSASVLFLSRRNENIFIFSLINGCKLVIDPHLSLHEYVLCTRFPWLKAKWLSPENRHRLPSHCFCVFVFHWNYSENLSHTPNTRTTTTK